MPIATSLTVANRIVAGLDRHSSRMLDTPARPPSRDVVGDVRARASSSGTPRACRTSSCRPRWLEARCMGSRSAGSLEASSGVRPDHRLSLLARQHHLGAFVEGSLRASCRARAAVERRNPSGRIRTLRSASAGRGAQVAAAAPGKARFAALSSRGGRRAKCGFARDTAATDEEDPLPVQHQDREVRHRAPAHQNVAPDAPCRERSQLVARPAHRSGRVGALEDGARAAVTMISFGIRSNER